MSGGESVKAEVSVTDDGGSSGDQQVELDGRRETRDGMCLCMCACMAHFMGPSLYPLYIRWYILCICSTHMLVVFTISCWCSDTTIPIGALNVGYSAGAAEGIGLEEVMAGGWTSGGAALSEAVCENSNDSCSLGPVTPQRAPEQSPG